MSGVQHSESSDTGAKQALDLVEACSKIFDGHDTAVVLGALTTLVTVSLDDTGVPIEVFVGALRGSQAKLDKMRKARSKR
jgi:hypothetical protein